MFLTSLTLTVLDFLDWSWLNYDISPKETPREHQGTPKNTKEDTKGTLKTPTVTSVTY